MSDIIIETEGAVARITLNRPDKLNAMTPGMADAMEAAIAGFNADDAIRCIVLSGAGERAFCAGSDINALADNDTIWKHRNRQDYCGAVRRAKKPVIAAINGYALGGGLEMAMACDIRVAARSARFGAPEIKLGWIGGGGMSVHLAHSIGPSNAAMMLMTGDPVDAERALSWTLVSEILEPDALMPRAMELAATIAARAPVAAQMAKLNLAAAYSMPLDDAIRYELDLQAIASATEDAAEGQAAFREKRAPDFKAR